MRHTAKDLTTRLHFGGWGVWVCTVRGTQFWQFLTKATHYAKDVAWWLRMPLACEDHEVSPDWNTQARYEHPGSL